MALIDQLLTALDEREIASEVAARHDNFRAAFAVPDDVAVDFAGYLDFVGDYYNRHYGACVAHGGYLSRDAANQSAREIIERDYRRRGGDIATAFSDARDSLNSGVRMHLDLICDQLKAEATHYYVKHVFDTLVKPNDWDTQVELIRQFIDACGSHLAATIDRQRPERYARNYEDLVNAYVAGLQAVSAKIRGL